MRRTELSMCRTTMVYPCMDRSNSERFKNKKINFFRSIFCCIMSVTFWVYFICGSKMADFTVIQEFGVDAGSLEIHGIYIFITSLVPQIHVKTYFVWNEYTNKHIILHHKVVLFQLMVSSWNMAQLPVLWLFWGKYRLGHTRDTKEFLNGMEGL